MCFINELLDELFAKILNRVPIKHIFVLMRVSKRWEVVCRQAVRTRKSLTIGEFIWSCQDDPILVSHKYRPSPLDNISVADESLVPLMMKSLNQIKNVKQLCVAKINPQNVSGLICKLAGQLTLLEVDFAIGDVGADVFPHLTHLYCWNFDAKRASAFPKLAELFIEESMRLSDMRDMRLPCLKRLQYSSCHDHELIREFILANSSNLEFLSVDFFELTFDKEVVLKNITKLEIGSIDKEMVQSLPAIRHLTLQMPATVAVLSRLPAAQMLSLDVRFAFDSVAYEVEEEDEDGEDEKEGLDEFAAVISRMSNLKELSIFDVGTGSSNEKKDQIQAPSSMSDKLHQLEKLSIITNYAHFAESRFNWDSVMFSLSQQNPNLRDICFRGIDLTSAAFASLAELQHLSHITMKHSVSENDSTHQIQVMTDNILMLLRGSSRNGIHKLRTWLTDPDIDLVTREFELMANERGTTFDKLEDFSYSDFKIDLQFIC